MGSGTFVVRSAESAWVASGHPRCMAWAWIVATSQKQKRAASLQPVYMSGAPDRIRTHDAAYLPPSSN